ncbi:MAG: single-strand binding protein [Actinotalea sp.]|nr:single-strand binding protein [Actinotalea sp.]
MSSNGLMVTVVGWAASTPREVVGDGVPFTSFRVATTPRYFDNKQGAWADGRTEWITVKAFRDVAYNVASSIRKGDPVLVQGRLRTEEWISDQGPRTGLVLDAHALGHDLTRGRGTFARSVHVAVQTGDDGSEGSGAASLADLEDPWATEIQPAGPLADEKEPAGATP